MATRHYIAILEIAPGGGLSISFPAMPGITSAADSFAGAMNQAKDALATAIENMEAANKDVPNHRTGCNERGL